MAASYREVRRYLLRDCTSSMIAEAMRACKMKVKNESDVRVKGGVSITLWSFGEKVEVSLSTVDGRTVIDVTSECAMPTQVLDWGKNRKNVQQLFSEIEQRAGCVGQGELVGRCSRCDYLLVGLHAACCPECGQPHNAPGAQLTQGKKKPLLIKGLIFAGVLTLLEAVIMRAILPPISPSVLTPATLWLLLISLLGTINLVGLLLLLGLNHLAQRRAKST